MTEKAKRNKKCKWWRKNGEEPFLALHGIFDNAATFDELVPLLNKNVSVLALDLPGHGKSSHPPSGITLNLMEVVFWLHYLIKDYFKWNKVNFLSHSLGSNLSYIYSGTFPEEVNTFISIDCSRFHMAQRTKNLISDLRKVYETHDLKSIQVPYEGKYEVFYDYFYNSRKNAGLPLSEKAIKILLSRDLEKIGEGLYRMDTDRRLHLKYVARPSFLYLDGLAKKIKCSMLVIKGTEGLFVNEHLRRLEDQLEIISKNSSKLVSELVEGGHHIHLENPESTADIINQFLNSR